LASPVQIVLNPENYEVDRDRGGGGSRTDFFFRRDTEFARHKAIIAAQLHAVADALEAQAETDIGYVKVKLRRTAWAKTHRPFGMLFKDELTPLAGGLDLGELIVEARPTALRGIATKVGEAEPESRTRDDPRSARAKPNPTALRSEVGAIERIELYGPEDRVDFSVDEAVSWLASPMTGGTYEVELFDDVPPRSDWDAYSESRRRLFTSFAAGLEAFGASLATRRLEARETDRPMLLVRPQRAGRTPDARQLAFRLARGRGALTPFSPDRDLHTRLLAFLSRHPLVRSVSLPGVLIRAPETRASAEGRTRPAAAPLPERDRVRAYPRVGIVDGGVGPALSDWVVDRWGLLDATDTNAVHGTFIGGLLVAGRSLNGDGTCPEPDGVEIADLDVFPDETKPGAFASYYGTGLDAFFDELGQAIGDVRQRSGVRVFNMSLNIQRPAAPGRYSTHAARLDRIADEHGAIIFISAGNTSSQSSRAEWPADPVSALASIAAARDDALLTPAESFRGVAVAAVNPPGCPPAIPFAPARYSRRGPAVRSGLKPDLAHVGGSGSPQKAMGHGLFSVTPSGDPIDGCGTSYAAPLAAKTAAVLEHMVEGEVSRETLVGLLAHHAGLPEPLRAEQLAPVAQHLVGFGIPPSAERILDSGDHAITLVFASRLKPAQQVVFPFRWPPSLVSDGGKCRGFAKLTLVSSPPLDARFGAEVVRVNLEASLQQLQANGSWKGRLKPRYLPESSGANAIEAERIEHEFKWSPVKSYDNEMKRVGPSNVWRLNVSYLTRARQAMPQEGVPFTAILTIADPEAVAPVFNDVRLELQQIGARISDIRTAARITTRI